MKQLIRYYEGESWKDQRGTAAILYRLPANDNRVTFQFVKGPENVLRLLDNMGIELIDSHTLATGQKIDDWFKAQDVSIDETIIRTLKKFGYKVFEDSIDKQFNDADGVIRMFYPKDNSKEVGEYIVVLTEDKVVAKEFCEYEGASRVLSCEYIPFNDEELRLFDDLGFDIESAQKSSNDQKIDDWFWKYKANDADIRDVLIDRVEALGYELRVERDYAHIFFLADDYESQPLVQHGDKVQKIIYNGIRLYFDLEYMAAEKTREDWIEERQILQSEYVAFSRKELQLLDDLGFHIDLNQVDFGPKQNIDDWFKKANDIDIKQTIVDFYKKNYPKLEVDATYNKTIYIIKKDKAYQIETNIYLDSKTVSRFRRRLKDGIAWGYETFDMQELKLFDNLGFEFDSEYKTYTHQRMDDWFREENQNKK